MSLPKKDINKDQFNQQVSCVIDKVRPQIQSHGGDLELVEAKNGKVVVKISGACLGCPMTQITFGEQMEELIKSEVPQVKTIKFIS